ncbi:hypothetical protein ACFQYP_02810 [Nonomuraea antimicrobica]
MLLRVSLVVLAVFLGGLAPAVPARAHDATTTAHAEVTAAGGVNVRVVLDLEYDLLMKSAWLYAEAYEAKGRDEQLRQLRINRDAVTSYITERFAVAYDERPCAPTMASEADVRPRGKKTFALLTLSYACQGAGGERTRSPAPCSPTPRRSCTARRRSSATRSTARRARPSWSPRARPCAWASAGR